MTNPISSKEIRMAVMDCDPVEVSRVIRAIADLGEPPEHLDSLITRAVGTLSEPIATSLMHKFPERVSNEAIMKIVEDGMQYNNKEIIFAVAGALGNRLSPDHVRAGLKMAEMAMEGHDKQLCLRLLTTAAKKNGIEVNFPGSPSHHSR